MSTRVRGSADSVAKALQAEKDGVAFFEKAYSVSNDPRVRGVFERLAAAKKVHLRNLEDGLRDLHMAAAGEARHSTAYPFADILKTECYVCGYGVESGEVPESCPRCGASRYAFEKEISLRKAWELAENGSRTTLKILADAEKEATPAVRPIIAKQMQLEQRLLDETRKELEALNEE